MQKNTKHMGKHERAMYEFAQKHLANGRVHSLAKDALTQRTAHQLVQRGLISINKYNQMTLVMDEADCKHPPSRLYSWLAKDGILCVCCCQCGAVLQGGAE